MTSRKNKLAIITGTGGLGLQTAIKLAAMQIDIIVAGRNPEKGEKAIAAIRQSTPDATAVFEPLDLASLASVRSFSERIADTCESVDILINNAGIMAPPDKILTADGFELQFGTNYLGHFALTQQLHPLLKNSGSARVVSVSSLAYRATKIDDKTFVDTESYKPFIAYAESKLAQLLFALELQRRSDLCKWHIRSSAAHPGFAATDIFSNQKGGMSRTLLNAVSKYLVHPLLGQSAADGARPIAYAATSDDAQGGILYGPGGLFEMSGPPAISTLDKQAKNPGLAASLWTMSEELTGLKFPAC